MKIYLLLDKNLITGYSYKALPGTIEFEIENPKTIQTGLDLFIDGKIVSGVKSATAIKSDRIAELKRLLSETDYLCMKHADGDLTDEEYAEVRENRHNWRLEINQLEEN